MASPTKLSANEVAALVGGLMNMDDGADGDGVEVRSYKFGTNDLSILGDYYALRMINERFCRLARSVFLPMLRFQPRISAFPPEMKSFDDYSDGLENFVSLSISRVEELRGSQLIVIPPSFVAMLTDSYYGGSIRDDLPSRTEFTATEQRVIEIVTDGLNRSLELAWRDLAQLSFNVQNREENLQFATFVDAEDMVINCSFMVQLPDSDHASFDIIYPLQTLKPIASLLRSRMQSDLLDADMSWRDKLVNALMDVPIELTARFAEPEIALKSLQGIGPGVTVPITMSPNPQLLIDNTAMFDADIGSRDGRVALHLNRQLDFFK